HAQGPTTIVIAGHPHLAIPARLMKARDSKLRTIVMSHGIEVWCPLPLWRRLALRHADCLLAPSTDTSRKLVEVQSAEKAKVFRLAWPVNDEILRLANDPGSLQPPPDFPQGQVILTVGRWAASERYKGADDLIEVTSQLSASIPDLFLVAVG